ncbi:hypothetical protein ACF3DV_26710 [Chlorogloeopsis fritschii PCC 9212]|uniref:Uncharacterized protein n=1 Tax=Chlorogloeopsis fritschii PCC 6912 TaxID=211165 RepID=A0A433N3U9_CHLFR|nr:hypothetical protein [Chlorogloeopsis fritschii]RUR75935.1 hypothetical protein PCC6912_45070 [Chlorogloeopsis fritschii PCC 6912]
MPRNVVLKAIALKSASLLWAIAHHILTVLNRTDIGGLTLSRTNLVAAAREMMRETRLLELVGSPGAVKSAVLKALVEIQQGEGPVILFAGDRIIL